MDIHMSETMKLIWNLLGLFDSGHLRNGQPPIRLDILTVIVVREHLPVAFRFVGQAEQLQIMHQVP